MSTLADVPARITGAPQSRDPELLPWEWKKPDQPAGSCLSHTGTPGDPRVAVLTHASFVFEAWLEETGRVSQAEAKEFRRTGGGRETSSKMQQDVAHKGVTTLTLQVDRASRRFAASRGWRGDAGRWLYIRAKVAPLFQMIFVKTD